MVHLTVTDSIEKMVAMAGLMVVSLAPRFQVGDIALIWETLQLPLTGFLLLVIGAFLKNFIYTRATVERWQSDTEKERAKEQEAADKAYKAMMDEHMKAMEMIERERQREREQSQARLDATREHYEARLSERDTLLKENTALLARAVLLLNEQQPVKAA